MRFRKNQIFIRRGYLVKEILVDNFDNINKVSDSIYSYIMYEVKREKIGLQKINSVIPVRAEDVIHF